MVPRDASASKNCQNEDNEDEKPFKNCECFPVSLFIDYDCHDVRLSIVRNVKIFIFKFKEGKLIGRHLRVD